MKHVSVVQHTQSEWLGSIEDHLEGRGIRFSYFRPFTAGGALPQASVIGDGLILLGGGPWGTVADGHPLPTLGQEVRLARACLMLGKPILGFGLGAQILALAADGTTSPAALTLSVDTVRRTRSGALGGHLPATMSSIVYMRDRPVPPAYAQVLAVDAEDCPAIFQIGANAFGFTGHPGIRRAMIEDLIMEFEDAPAEPAPALSRIATIGPAIDDALVPLMTGLVAACGWM
jgi:GMP synthase-like glutamine amidotransferase